MMKALVIGANGQLGTDLVRTLSERRCEVLKTTHAQLDVRDYAAVESIISAAKPDVVINTSAFHKVEECERNPQLAFDVNAIAAMGLAKSCAANEATLVHISTDYVFDGKQREPYSETDLPNPLNVYGASKVAGEHLIANNTDRYFIVRTCGLYGLAGSSGKGGNFVETMLRKGHVKEPIRVVSDQVLSPTYTADLAQGILELASSRSYGLYHFSGAGQCSWFDFARAIFELEGLEVDITPVSTDQFPSPVKRPAYSVMSKNKIESIGVTSVRPWQDALQRYLRSKSLQTSRSTL